MINKSVCQNLIGIIAIFILGCATDNDIVESPSNPALAPGTVFFDKDPKPDINRPIVIIKVDDIIDIDAHTLDMKLRKPSKVIDRKRDNGAQTRIYQLSDKNILFVGMLFGKSNSVNIIYNTGFDTSIEAITAAGFTEDQLSPLLIELESEFYVAETDSHVYDYVNVVRYNKKTWYSFSAVIAGHEDER